MDNCRFFNSRKLFAGKLSSAILLDDPFHMAIYGRRIKKKSASTLSFQQSDDIL